MDLVDGRWAGELDIVVCTDLTGGNLAFLDVWRPLLEPYHLIVVQAGGTDGLPIVPAGFDHELVTRNDMRRVLGPRASMISTAERSVGT